MIEDLIKITGPLSREIDGTTDDGGATTELSRWLRALRKARGLSDKDMGVRLGIDASGWRLYESGRGSQDAPIWPSEKRCRQLAAIFQIPLDVMIRACGRKGFKTLNDLVAEKREREKTQQENSMTSPDKPTYGTIQGGLNPQSEINPLVQQLNVEFQEAQRLLTQLSEQLAEKTPLDLMSASVRPDMGAFYGWTPTDAVNFLSANTPYEWTVSKLLAVAHHFGWRRKGDSSVNQTHVTRIALVRGKEAYETIIYRPAAMQYIINNAAECWKIATQKKVQL